MKDSFKVGDRVRIRPGSDIPDSYMFLKNQIHKIAEVNGSRGYTIKVGGWNYLLYKDEVVTAVYKVKV